LGYSLAEFTSLSSSEVLALVYFEDRAVFFNRFKDRLEGKQAENTYEFRAIRKDGSIIWLEAFATLIEFNGKPAVQSVFLNIDKRKKVEEALRKSEEEHSSLFANMIDGFAFCQMIFDDAGKPVDFVYLQINDAFEKITGLKRDVVVGKKVTEAIPGIKAANPELFEIYGRVAVSCQNERFEVFFKPLGMWLNISVYCPRKGYFAAVFEDISERKKAEEATAKQAELIDLSPDAIIVRKLDGTITFWSKGAEKLYGLTKKEAIGKDINSLLKTEFPESLEKILKKLKLDGKWSGEIVHTCKSGDKLVVQSYWLGKFDSDGKVFEMLESNVDITDRIQMQIKLEESAVRLEEYANQMESLADERAAQLKDAERLAAIGATAGMVGHDIRNPLQAITGDVYLAKTDLIAMPESDEKKSIQESLSGIEKNVDYINKIVADLQDFARPLKPNVEETDLKLIIDDLLKKNGLPENVKVTVKVDADSRKVVADPTFINRIMYNLVNNAVQAMPSGGKLTIHAYKEAKDVLITVKDTGVGIPEKVKEKLFTPMFTTKSKGQGFGLVVIKRMTEALGGTVTFESEEGKGTTFFIRLPFSSKK
jgi:PAS domain S-box-containing protein